MKPRQDFEIFTKRARDMVPTEKIQFRIGLEGF